MIMIDALGQPCPIPVVKAKQAIAALPAGGGAVEVLVDNVTACENLAKMAKGMGHGCEVRTLPDGNHLVTIAVGGGSAVGAPAAAVPAPAVSRDDGTPPAAPLPQTGLVVAVGSDCMGRGSEELGRILIKGFIYSLSQMEPPPAAVLFFNSGVRLVLDDANTVEDVRALIGKGCRALVCGTCVNYYRLGERIAAGDIVTMYDIVEAMGAGRSVVSI